MKRIASAIFATVLLALLAVSPTVAQDQQRPAPPACIDINTAGFVALQEIIHIGEVRAREIITLRQQRPFRSIQELTRVNGIAAARLRDIVAQGKACVK